VQTKTRLQKSLRGGADADWFPSLTRFIVAANMVVARYRYPRASPLRRFSNINWYLCYLYDDMKTLLVLPLCFLPFKKDSQG
jgi:hypothetical protein